MLSVSPEGIPPPILPVAPTPLQGVVSQPTSMGPAIFDSTFEFSNIYFQSGGNFAYGNGAGQTIAIVDPYGSPSLVNDVKTFDNFWGLSNNDSNGRFFLTIQPLSPTANTISEPSSDVLGWSAETSLDVEWAHAVAPGAHIMLVQAPSDSILDLLDANVFAAEQPGVVTVSDSWSTDDNNPFFQGEPAVYDGYFVTPTGHLDSNGLEGGVSFFAASGDGKAATPDALQWPAASTNVISVGGMTVATDLNGGLQNIAPWNNPLGHTQGSIDTQYATSIQYNEPLVSLDADPLTGVWIYDSTSGSGLPTAGWNVIGGTSLATPAWAAYTAIIDQGLAIEGLPSLNSQWELGAGADMNNLQYNILAANEAGASGTIGNLKFDFSSAPSEFVSYYNGQNPQYPLWPNQGQNAGWAPNQGVQVPDMQAVPSLQNTGFGLPRGNYFAAFITGQAATADLVTLDGELAPFNVPTPVTPTSDYLHFIQQPTITPAGQIISPNIEVEAISQTSNTVDTTYDGPITITLGSGAGTSIIGTTTVDAVNGIATFTGLSINQLGDYTIFATANGLVPVQSSDFTVGPAAGASLTVSQEPGVAWQFGTIPNIVVSVLDEFGNLDSTGQPSNVSVSIASGPANAILTGVLTVATVNGVATFKGLSVNLPGNYTFKFIDGNLTTTISAAATIVPIPIEEHFTFNGLGLSSRLLVQQQERNALLFTIQGPPTPAQVAQAQQEGQNAEVDALFGTAFVAAQTAVPASTFSSASAISADSVSTADSSSVLDVVGTGDSNLLDK